MKIGFLTTSYPSDTNDPRGVHIHRIASALVRRRVEVVVAAPVQQSLAYQIDGVTVVPLECAAAREGHLSSGISGIVPNLQRKPWLGSEIPGLIRALGAGVDLLDDVDLLHCHWVLPSGWVASRRLSRDTPLVVTSHGGDVNLVRRLPVLGSFARRALQRADAVVGVSDAVSAELRRLGVPNHRLVTLSVGVPIGPELARRRLASPLRVLYVGGLSRRKSVDTLVRAFKRVDGRAELKIVGSGPTQVSLQRLIARLSVANAELVGPVAPSDVGRLMQWADVLVLPSRSEGKPTVVMEAMAAGLAVLATDIPGTRELVDPGKTGFLFPVGSWGDLERRLSSMADDPEQVQNMGRAAWEVANTFSIEAVADKHVEIYERVLSR